MLASQATRKSIHKFLERKFQAQPWEEDNIQFYARDMSGNVYHVDSLVDADSVVFRYKN